MLEELVGLENLTEERFERVETTLGLPDIDDEPEDAEWEARYTLPAGITPFEFIGYLQSVMQLARSVQEATRKPTAALKAQAKDVSGMTASIMGVVELPKKPEKEPAEESAAEETPEEPEEEPAEEPTEEKEAPDAQE